MKKYYGEKSGFVVLVLDSTEEIRDYGDVPRDLLVVHEYDSNGDSVIVDQCHVTAGSVVVLDTAEEAFREVWHDEWLVRENGQLTIRVPLRHLENGFRRWYKKMSKLDIQLRFAFWRK
jgi:hypothetical protein